MSEDKREHDPAAEARAEGRSPSDERRRKERRKTTVAAAGEALRARNRHPPSRERRGFYGGMGAGAALAVAAFALIVALAALITAGWLGYQSQNRVRQVGAEIERVRGRIPTDWPDTIRSGARAALSPELAALDKRLGALNARLDDRGQTLTGLRQQARENTRAVDALRRELVALRGQNKQLSAQVAARELSARLAGIESMLVTAGQRLRVDRDPRGTLRALRAARQMIARGGDPRLRKISARIDTEIAAVQKLPIADIAGAAQTLGEQIDAVPTLALAAPKPTPPAEGRAKNSGLDAPRTQANRGGNPPVDSAGGAPSSSPDRRFFSTQNLRLELAAARGALLEGRGQAYRDSLDSARRWLQRYFDTGASGVARMIDTLGRLAQIELDWQAPDISASLRSVRRLSADAVPKKPGGP